MSATAKAVCLVVAFAAFVVETVRSRSLVAGGLAAATLPFAWDAVDAA